MRSDKGHCVALFHSLSTIGFPLVDSADFSLNKAYTDSLTAFTMDQESDSAYEHEELHCSTTVINRVARWPTEYHLASILSQATGA